MANAVQATAKKAMLDQLLALGTLKATIVDLADYTYNAGHDFINDVPAPARVATANVTGVTTTAGTLDAADTTFTSVSGDQSEALVLWVDTGSETTSPYLAFWDSGVTGFPLTPVGSNVVAQWSASGIITLT
jgi:hypothetical protein